jgi:hypothetical protein
MKTRAATAALLAAACATAARLEAQPPEATPAPSLLEAPAPFVAALRSRFGPQGRILSLRVQHDGAEVQIQDPATPMHVDRYEFEDGRLGEAEPVQVGRNRRRLEARLFDLADVDLTIVPGLLSDARARARTEDGRTTHVLIERQDAGGEYESWGRPVIRVYVDGPRGGAFVEYGLDGKHRHVTRW